jgi:hypothetical protein
MSAAHSLRASLESLGRDIFSPDVIEDDILGGHQFAASVGNFRGNLVRNRCDAIEVSVQQIAVEDRDTTDGDGNSDRRDVAISVSANGPVGEGRKPDRRHLIEVASGSRCDQPLCSEGLICRAHHLSERCRRDRFVEILKDDDRRAGQFTEGFHLGGHARIDVALAGSRLAAKRRGQRVSDHRGNLGKARFDRLVHVADISRSHVEQFDHVADGGSIVGGEIGRVVFRTDRVDSSRVEPCGNGGEWMEIETGQCGS